MSETDFSLVLPIQPPLRISYYKELEPKVSGLTGKALRRCQVSFTVAGDDRNDEVNAVFSAASSDDASERVSDTEGGEWRVGNHTASFRTGTQMYNHSVELEEREVVELTVVEIDGVTLTPERWQVDGSGVLTFLVNVDVQAAAELDQILERHLPADSEQRYFPVRLSGVSDMPASWRFGQCLWQAPQDGITRHLITLVPQTSDGDDNAGLGLFQPELLRLVQQSALTKMRLDAVIKELHAADVLNADALARITPDLTVVPFAAMREFDRANDVDDFFG